MVETPRTYNQINTIMTETQQSPKDAVPGAHELSAAEGVRNAEAQNSTSAASQTTTPAQGGGEGLPKELEFINKTTGRSYKTLEDAEKGLRETVSYVGTLGQRAAMVDKLAKRIAKENNVSEDAAIQYVSQLIDSGEQQVADAEPQQAAREVAQPSVRTTPQDIQYKMLQEQLMEERLLRKFPEAEKHVDLIKRASRADGRDYADIYEKEIKPLMDAGKQQAYANQESKGGAAVASTSREAPPQDPYKQVLEAFKKGKATTMDLLRAKGMRIEAR